MSNFYNNRSSGKKVVLTSIITFAALLFLYAIYQARQAGTREKAREQLQAEITNLIVQYKNCEIETIDLSKISSITWDRFYVFGPYIPLENIQKILGSPWSPDGFFVPAPPRPFNYLVFTFDGQVVQYVEYPISDFVSFSGAEGRHEGYTPSEALFVINEYGYVLWLYE